MSKKMEDYEGSPELDVDLELLSVYEKRLEREIRCALACPTCHICPGPTRKVMCALAHAHGSSAAASACHATSSLALLQPRSSSTGVVIMSIRLHESKP